MQETPKAAAAYAAYEAMGPDRSLDKLIQQLRHNGGKLTARLRTLEQWSSDHGWQARVAAYDAAQRERERAQREAADAERARRKLERELRRDDQRATMDDNRAAVFGQEWAKVLKAVNKKIDDGDARGLVGLVAVLNRALDEERLSLGSPTQMTAHVGKDGGPLEYIEATDAARRKLAGLAAASNPGSVPVQPDAPGS